MPQQQAAGIGRTVTRILRYVFLGPIPIAQRRAESKVDHYLVLAMGMIVMTGAMTVGMAVFFSFSPPSLSSQETITFPEFSAPYVVHGMLFWLGGVALAGGSVWSSEYEQLFKDFEVQKDLSFYGLLISCLATAYMSLWNFQSIAGLLYELEAPWASAYFGVIILLLSTSLLLGFYTILIGLHASGWLLADRYGEQIQNGLNDFF